MNSENTQKVLNAVAKAQRDVSAAETRFDIEGRRIQREASYTTISIYNMSKAVEILAAVKRSTDDLYTSYESAVYTLDMQCRPLLATGVSAEAIKKVADLIKQINADSSGLSSNATGTLNGYSLGDLRTEHYIASLEARTIEKFWIAKYESTPEFEAEKKRKDALAAERRKIQAEQAKIAAEKKRKADEERKRQAELKAAEEARISKINEDAKAHLDRCVQDCQNKVETFRRDLISYINTQEKIFKKEIDTQIKSLLHAIEKQRVLLNELGPFKFTEKKAAKQEIKKLEARVLKYKDPSIIKIEIDSMHIVLEEAVDAYQKTVEAYLKKRFADYKTSGKKNPKKDLLYVENAAEAQKGCPPPPSVKKVFE